MITPHSEFKEHGSFKVDADATSSFGPDQICPTQCTTNYFPGEVSDDY